MEHDQEAADIAQSVLHLMTQRGVDMRKAQEQCKALLATIDALQEELAKYKWREMHYTVQTESELFYRHGEAIWLRTSATDSQISAMLKSRDDAFVARSKADRDVGLLTGERDELSRQLAELTQIVGADSPAAALTLVQTWQAEKAALQEEIAEIKQAANDACQSVYEEWRAGTAFENMPLAIASRMALAWMDLEQAND